MSDVELNDDIRNFFSCAAYLGDDLFTSLVSLVNVPESVHVFICVMCIKYILFYNSENVKNFIRNGM